MKLLSQTVYTFNILTESSTWLLKSLWQFTLSLSIYYKPRILPSSILHQNFWSFSSKSKKWYYIMVLIFFWSVTFFLLKTMCISCDLAVPFLCTFLLSFLTGAHEIYKSNQFLVICADDTKYFSPSLSFNFIYRMFGNFIM